jgi:hypothetical protein
VDEGAFAAGALAVVDAGVAGAEPESPDFPESLDFAASDDDDDSDELEDDSVAVAEDDDLDFPPRLSVL